MLERLVRCCKTVINWPSATGFTYYFIDTSLHTSHITSLTRYYIRHILHHWHVASYITIFPVPQPTSARHQWTTLTIYLIVLRTCECTTRNQLGDNHPAPGRTSVYTSVCVCVCHGVHAHRTGTLGRDRLVNIKHSRSLHQVNQGQVHLEHAPAQYTVTRAKDRCITQGQVHSEHAPAQSSEPRTGAFRTCACTVQWPKDRCI